MAIEIERIELSPVQKAYRDVRCSKQVRGCGPAFDGPRHNHCERRAIFNIDGSTFCVQHAGEVALKYLLENQG